METYGITDFIGDIGKGKTGENIFKDDFLNFMQIEFVDVSGRQAFQLKDTDMLAKIGTYEIKANYKDDQFLIIEEYTNYNPAFGPESKGWFYKSKADVLVFVSKDTRVMILLPFTDAFKKHYESIKARFQLKPNKVSGHNGRNWQSAYRRIPLSALKGFFAYYKKPEVES